MLVGTFNALYITYHKGSDELETKAGEQRQVNASYLTGKSGLGGWLVLVQIGLWSSLIMLLFSLVTSVLTIDVEVWEAVTSKGSEYYHPLWGPFMIAEIIINMLLLIFCIYIIVKFYGKKSTLPRLMIIFYIVNLAIIIVDYILVLQIPLLREMDNGDSIKEIVRAVLVCAIWTAYFTQSVRVKNTFVN